MTEYGVIWTIGSCRQKSRRARLNCCAEMWIYLILAFMRCMALSRHIEGEYGRFFALNDFWTLSKSKLPIESNIHSRQNIVRQARLAKTINPKSWRNKTSGQKAPVSKAPSLPHRYALLLYSSFLCHAYFGIGSEELVYSATAPKFFFCVHGLRKLDP